MSKITIDRSLVEQALEALNASMPHNNDMDGDWPSHIAARRALRAALEQPRVKQEPVAWEGRDGYLYHFIEEPKPGDRPLYTHPQPPLQPLTDQVIQELADEGVFHANVFEIVRRIEEEHGIFKLRAQGIGGEK